MSLDYNFWKDEEPVVLPAPPAAPPPVEVSRDDRRHLMTDAEWYSTCAGNQNHPQNTDPFECLQCYGCHGSRTNRNEHIKRDGVWEVLSHKFPSVCAGPEDAPHPEVRVEAQQPCPVCHCNGYRPLQSWD